MVNSSLVYDGLCSGVEVAALLLGWLLLYLLLLPLFLRVLYVGHTQRRRHAPSHSDIFTYNIVAMEILNIIGTCFYSPGVVMRARFAAAIGDHLFVVGVTAQMFLHALTCVERYLAVVHPITYLRLKKGGGVTIRNSSVAGAVLLSVMVSCLQNVVASVDCGALMLVTVASLAVGVVSFCSASVLQFLTRPGPGKAGGALRRVDQSKRRALVTMAAVTGVLLLRFLVVVPAFLVYSLRLLPPDAACLFSVASSWFYLPSSLVLPLLFLNRTRKRNNKLNKEAGKQN